MLESTRECYRLSAGAHSRCIIDQTEWGISLLAKQSTSALNLLINLSSGGNKGNGCAGINEGRRIMMVILKLGAVMEKFGVCSCIFREISSGKRGDMAHFTPFADEILRKSFLRLGFSFFRKTWNGWWYSEANLIALNIRWEQREYVCKNKWRQENPAGDIQNGWRDTKIWCM